MRSPSTILTLTVVCLCGWAETSGAQDGPEPLRWRAQPDGGGPAALESGPGRAAEVLSALKDRHVVLQFKQVPGANERANLQANGVLLLRYLGSNAFFARLRGGKAAVQAATRSGLQAAAGVQRAWKLHPRLARGEIPEYARIPAGLSAPQNGTEQFAQGDFLALYVLFHPDVNLDKEAVAAIGRHGGTVRRLLRSIHGAVIWLPATGLEALADEDAVQWLEPPLPPLDVTNDQVRSVTQADAIQTAPYGLNGAGINVMVYDGGTGMAGHLDFGGRLHRRDSTEIGPHPTHVAGTIGGDGTVSDGLYRGMAPGVELESFGFEFDGVGQFLYTDPGDLETDYDKAINTYGAVIANNSIGTNVAMNGYPCDWEGDYGATSMLIDAIVRGSLGSPMRIIWSAGNERGSGRCGVEYHTTAPPSNAKNHISVGAINSNDESMTTFSSWGPSDDGRLKPDICAPGCQNGGDNGVTSTYTSGGYNVMCGTSMSAPAVTGLAALLLQDWKNLRPDEPLPPNSMIKVLLTHNARDLGNVGPDYQFGYGSVRIQDTIDFLRGGAVIQGQIDHAEELLYFVPMLASGVPIKVTIAWDDPPGAINTIPELVNDLDLELVSPTGVTHFPWTLDPANPAAPAVRTGPDRVNNIEQVMVEQPEVGTWSIIVRGHSVPSGPQAFSLAASPELRNCSSAGLVMFKSPKFGCSSSISVMLKDCDLDSDPNAVETASVTVSSSSEPAGETVTLTETAPFSATFEGSLPTSDVDSTGVLQVAHGDTLVATYLDSDDGQGQTNVTVTDEAVVDCEPPVISAPQVGDVSASTAKMVFATDEPSRAAVKYGTSCASSDTIASERYYLTAHNILLSGLTKNTQYFFLVEARDEAGNQAILDNNGSCFSFSTLDRQDYFTELFTPSGFDLAYRAVTFVPQAGIHHYVACTDTVSALPVGTEGSQSIYLSDDSYAEINLAEGLTIPFYGIPYSTFFVGSNGFVTFNQGDGDYTESLADHFDLPRISVLFDDFNPPSNSVKWRQLSDRVAVTWEDVPEYGQYGTQNTFQLVMHFDGTIEMAWLAISTQDGLVGLSEGLGLPADFESTDVSAAGSCIGLPAQAFDPRPAHLAQDVSVVTVLSWAAGNRADSHEVYFGTAPDQLNWLGGQTDTSFVLPALLNSTTYYWRVDEINDLAITVGNLWSFTTRALQADFDSDGDVDMTDYSHLQICFSGVDVPQEDPECQDARLDGDSDVDLDDTNLFEGCLSGADQEAVGACLP